MEPSLQSIFHAFNIPYKTIGILAPEIFSMGFTHIQFPPVQPTRILTELDSALLHSIFQNRSKQLREFEKLHQRTIEKDYPPHTFNFLLHKKVYSIRQPTLQHLHRILLSGIPMPDITKHLFETIHAAPDSTKFFVSILQTGTKHVFYPLIQAAELVLQWREKVTQTSIESLTQEYTKIRNHIKTLKPPISQDLLKRCAELKKQYTQEKARKNKEDAYQELRNIVPKAIELRSALLHNPHLLKNAPITRFIKSQDHWLNIITICEALLYPPWWLIYQPIDMEIGDTLLGSKQEILDAISRCKHHGLSVIADVVVNNVAAIAGEKQSWSAYEKEAQKIGANTLEDVADEGDPILTLRSLAYQMFGTRDLTMFRPPFECQEGQEPTICWMSGCLPQLDPNHVRVHQKQTAFFQHLKAAGVDGIRLDAAAHMSPENCKWMMESFPGLSYIEYIGGSESWRRFPANTYTVKKEDFFIGEDIYGTIFSEQGQIQKIKNYGGDRLHRLEDLDSVVMILNHDHLMGSLPSRIFESLPSEKTYDLSLAYLIQRIYGSVLVLPHDIQSEYVIDALELRKRMKEEHVVKEYVSESNNIITILKQNREGHTLFVSLINMNMNCIETIYGMLEPLSFRWVDVCKSPDVIKIYNSAKTNWLRTCYTRRNRKQTKKATSKGFTPRQTRCLPRCATRRNNRPY